MHSFVTGVSLLSKVLLENPALWKQFAIVVLLTARQLLEIKPTASSIDILELTSIAVAVTDRRSCSI